MSGTLTLCSIKTVQKALNVLALVELNAYLWPPHQNVPDKATFDYIIVGAGTAGCVVANRLTEDPDINVLLIEAGGDPPIETQYHNLLVHLSRSHLQWQYVTEPNERYCKCHQEPIRRPSSGKMLGGTSSMSYMKYFRGLPEDYNSWASIVEDNTWRWKNVLPYFKKAENFDDLETLNSPQDRVLHGTNGYLKISTDPYDGNNTYFKACKQLGYEIVPDINEQHPLGCTRLKLTVADGMRQSTAYAYLSPIKDRPNLHVIKNVHVTKINFDNNKNAVGVEAITKDGKTVTYNAKIEVVVCAGTFNTAKLLMLSGIGPKKHLQSKGINVIADLPVGENLQDLLTLTIIHKIQKQTTPPPPINPQEYPAQGIVGNFARKNCSNRCNYQIVTDLVNVIQVYNFCQYTFRFNSQLCKQLNESTRGRKLAFNQLDIINPKSRGKVCLMSKNPEDPLFIDAGYLSDEDLEYTSDYLVDYAKILNTTYYRNNNAAAVFPPFIKCNKFPIHSKQFYKCYSTCMITGNDNFVGTCAMGTVVDSKLLVKGVHKLRVIDGSVMPTITSTRVMGPIIMIGEKGADFIKKARCKRTNG